MYSLKLKSLRYSLSLILAALSLALAACNPAAPALQTEKLRMCFASNAATNFLPRYATRSGVFKEHGLEVEEVMVKGSKAAIAMLISGEADVCAIGADTVVAATTAGADVVFMLSFFNRNQGHLVASADVRSPQDLVGGKIAGQRPGSPVDRLIRRYLAVYGVSEDQVEFLNMGTTTQAERMSAVLSGNASATFVSTLTDAQLAVSKGMVVLVEPSQVDAPDRIGGAYAASRERIASKRATYLRFVKALVQAAARAKSDANGVQSALAEYAKLDPTKDAAILQAASGTMLEKYMSDPPYPSTQALQIEIDLLAEEVEAAKSKKPEDFMDATLLSEAGAP